MVRIGISVEGLTEERFVKGVLAPHFSSQEIYVTPVQIQGNVSVDRIKGELERLAYSFDFVTTFYDFYGFKRKEAHETKVSLEVRIESSIKEGLREKLIPYIQMHEFEGLLFSAPGVIASVLQDENLEGWAGAILVDFDNNPEMINNLPETAPSKRLIKQTSYRKTTHGPAIAEQIGLAKLREMCEGFHAWLARLEELGHSIDA
ncbi:MAG: DUF4276 family protein [Candidatus Thiodiazotropha sp. (ex Dulcina madagascariensis)]|nr:DUF4276 family protein [Candidatus Thiodiazotropha sp. (ex Dulcina madagascariensis)]